MSVSSSQYLSVDVLVTNFIDTTTTGYGLQIWPDDALKYPPAYEHIPEIWCTCATTDEYKLASLVQDEISAILQYLKFGRDRRKCRKGKRTVSSALTSRTCRRSIQRTESSSRYQLYLFASQFDVQRELDIINGFHCDIMQRTLMFADALTNATSLMGCPQAGKFNSSSVSQLPCYTM